MTHEKPTRPATLRTGPSRDMLGGPWLGLLVFVVIAVGLGWAVTKFFQGAGDQARQTLRAEPFNHGFDLDASYALKRDLLLGYLADGRIVLLPGRDDLPAGTPGRRAAASVQAFRENPADYPDLAGIVEAGSRVRFVEVIDDIDNPQTRILVLTKLLTGRYTRRTPVLGMHLESADTDGPTGAKRYVPRADLFELVEPVSGPVQSATPDPSQSDE